MGGLQRSALLFHTLDLLLACDIESARAYEFNDSAQLVFVEPGSVQGANINDDVGAFGEVDAVHQFVTDRAGDIADLFDVACEVGWELGGHAEDGGLAFAIGAYLLERNLIRPDALTFGALEELGVAQSDLGHASSATRAFVEHGGGGFGAVGPCTAMGTELRAEEHHAEAGWAGDGGQTRSTMLAFCRVVRGGGATHGTFQNFSRHRIKTKSVMPSG